MVFGSKKPEYKYNFHDDELLHDSTPQPGAWNSNLAGDAIAALKGARTLITDGFPVAAKDVASTLDINDPLSRLISKQMVSMLWGSMLHPPPSYRGPEFQYRAADGSNNNILFPKLGAADAPYAKTVQSIYPSYGAKPDPGDLFDLLMARNDKTKESESGLSSMLLFHATLIIHDIFRTDDDDPNKSATSSYLDLAPLYGSNEKAQKEVRQGKLGLLKPDTFSETRLLRQPPGVCIYLILYNRFHNYVAEQLLEINENGRFSLPADYDKLDNAKKQAAQDRLDHDLFNTARLVTCGMYIQIAIHDYLRCLMLLHAKDTAFTLDPRAPFPEHNNKTGLQRGEGNMVSVEFNLLYRFHSPISKREAWWSEDVFVQALQERGMIVQTEAEADNKTKFTKKTIVEGNLPFPLFRHMIEAGKAAAKVDRTPLKFFPPGLDPTGGWKETKDAHGNIIDEGDYFRFKRNKDGKFDDAQLAAEMIRVIEDPISSFGANNVPKVLRSVEIMGILQARQWEVASLNQFREFFGMSRHEHFEDINSDPAVQQKLRDLYEDPDMVELYPGLFCEGDSQCLDPGTTCPNKQSTALWRAVFSDAVTLVRSDRFYTLDWNVGSLTAWGMKEVTSDPKVNKGSVMHRLFQRALPGFFTYNSVHMWQPFYTPTMNLQLAQEQGYLQFLDLTGLEDENGTPWQIQRKKDGQVLTDFKRLCMGNKGKKVRRRMKLDLPTRWLNRNWEMQTTKAGRIGRGDRDYPWRGGERAYKAGVPIEITDYEVIRNDIFAQGKSLNFSNPSILGVDDIPGDVLQAIMTKKWDKWDSAVKVIWGRLGPKWEDTLMAYFVDLSQEVRLREQRAFQKCRSGDKEVQIYQLDVVSDYAIPIVTRFIADFLGFWTEVKTPLFRDRPYSENQIYRHLENCQNYDSYDADPTKTWARRTAYRASIKFLKDLTDKSIRSYEPQFLEKWFSSRSYGYEGDSEQVRTVRKLAVSIVQDLSANKFSHDEIVAVMLSTALDAAQKTVVTFTEAIAYFIDPKYVPEGHEQVIQPLKERTKLWGEVQDLAWRNATRLKNGNVKFKNDPEMDEKILGYVLEAQRFNPYMRIPRVYNPVSKKDDLVLAKGKTYSIGTTLLLNIFDAYHKLAQDHEDFPHSHKFDPTREASSYLIFGGDNKILSRRLALIAITGMIKHAAHLRELRVAHDKVGRLKRVKTPRDIWCYATVQWDGLLPSPITWNLRYTDVGKGVWTGGDNADQKHGQNQVVVVPKTAPTTTTTVEEVSAKGAVRTVSTTEFKTSSYISASVREVSRMSSYDGHHM